MEDRISKIIDEHIAKRLFHNLNLDEVKMCLTKASKDFYEPYKINTSHHRALEFLFEAIYGDVINIVNREEGNSIEGRRKLWDELYAFPDLDSEIDVDILTFNKSKKGIINANSKIAEKFVTEVLQIARTNYNISSKTHRSSYESRFIIVGDVGIGKSSFLRYIETFYNNLITNCNDILWLTIDLNYEYLNKLSIPDAIKFEATRWFRQNLYGQLCNDEKKKITDDFIRGFEDSEISKDIYTKKIGEFKETFEQERTRPFHDIIQRTIINYLETKYAPVYFIDGLDNISETNGFLGKLEDVRDILSDTKRRGVFFFVMRKVSHYSFLQTFVNHEAALELTRKNQGEIKILEIKPSPLYKILYNRFKALAGTWGTSLFDSRPIIFNQKYEHDSEITRKFKLLVEQFEKQGLGSFDSILSYFGFFMIFLIKGLRPEEEIDFKTWDIYKAIKLFCEFSGQNIRKLFDALSLANKAFTITLYYTNTEFIDVVNIYNLIMKERNSFFLRNDSSINKYNQIMKRDYMIIPMLLQANGHYNHAYYFQDDKNLTIKCKNNKDYSKFIYSVYYPVNCDKSTSKYNLLLKIRILQLLSFNMNDDLFEQDIYEFFLQYKFPYTPDSIHAAIDELFNSNLIVLDYTNGRYCFKIDKTAQHHIDTLIFDFGYLRIILDDILVPDGYAEIFSDPTPELYSNSKEKWIINQIPRVALFILLINRIEDWDLSELYEKERAKWQLTPKLIERFKQTAIKICMKSDKDLSILSASFAKIKAELTSKGL